MASFSRNTMMVFKLNSSTPSRICAQCLRQLKIAPSKRTTLSIRQQRPFSRSRILQQTPKLRSSGPRKDQRAAEASQIAFHSSGLTVAAHQLMQTITSPTILYEAPPQRALILAACGLSLFFVGYGVLNAFTPGMTFLFGAAPEKKEDKISKIIPPILIFVGGALVGIGVWSFGAVRGLVKRITVLPLSAEGKGDAIAVLRVSRLAPWRTHEFQVPLRDLALGRRVQDTAPAAESVAARYKDAKDTSVLLVPFMKMGSGIRSFFDETRNVFWRACFVSLDTGASKKGTYVIDARGSAYKGAVGLDRIIPVGEGRGRFWEGLG